VEIDIEAAALLTRAEALVPTLRTNAVAAEKARWISEDTLEALAAAGVFRMTAPRRYGGQQASFETQCQVLAAIARGCPSTSWVATIYSAMTWLAAVFPDEAQEEIFADRDPRMSGVFSPTGVAAEQAGGYVVKGRWPFNTGGRGSRWTGLVAIAPTPDGSGMPLFAIARSRELTTLDDWDATGMSATGSNTVVADDVFVPAHRVLRLPDLMEAIHPHRHNHADPYFRHPLAPVLAVNAGGTPIGIARGVYENFMNRLPNRGIAYTTYTSKKDAPITHLEVGEAALRIESAEAHVHTACALLDRHRDVPMSKEERVKARVHIAYATGLARKAVDSLFFASGASVIQTGIPLQRCQRDMQALANHAIMHSPTAIELYGRVLCGLEPNTPIY